MKLEIFKDIDIVKNFIFDEKVQKLFENINNNLLLNFRT